MQVGAVVLHVPPVVHVVEGVPVSVYPALQLYVRTSAVTPDVPLTAPLVGAASNEEQALAGGGNIMSTQSIQLK